MLETAAGTSDSTLRLQSLGGGVNTTVTLIEVVDSTMRVEFSGSAIKVFFDEVLKISAASALVQSDVEMGLVKATTGAAA